MHPDSFVSQPLSSRCFLVCITRLRRSLTHTLDHLEERSRRSPQPLYPYVRVGETPWCNRAEITEKRGKKQVVSRVLCTHGRPKGCAYLLSCTCFPSAFSVLFILHSIFAHGSLSDCRYAVLCILSGAVRMWFVIVR